MVAKYPLLHDPQDKKEAIKCSKNCDTDRGKDSLVQNR